MRRRSSSSSMSSRIARREAVDVLGRHEQAVAVVVDDVGRARSGSRTRRCPCPCSSPPAGSAGSPRSARRARTPTPRPCRRRCPRPGPRASRESLEPVLLDQPRSGSRSLPRAADAQRASPGAPSRSPPTPGSAGRSPSGGGSARPRRRSWRPGRHRRPASGRTVFGMRCSGEGAVEQLAVRLAVLLGEHHERVELG